MNSMSNGPPVTRAIREGEHNVEGDRDPKPLNHPHGHTKVKSPYPVRNDERQWPRPLEKAISSIQRPVTRPEDSNGHFLRKQDSDKQKELIDKIFKLR
jgi:hypothetical protein